MFADDFVVVVVKAWNVQAGSEFTLDGPKGQVLSMVVGNDTLLAGAEVTTMLWFLVVKLFNSDLCL